MEAVVPFELLAPSLQSRSTSRDRVKKIAEGLDAVCKTEGNTTRGKRTFPHPFPARMPLEVALAAVKHFAPAGSVVLDPMSGSGVVARAAQLSGRRSIGFDVDPLAVCLSRALTSTISAEQYEEAARRLYIRALTRKAYPGFIDGAFEKFSNEEKNFVNYWFPTNFSRQLIALSEAHKEHSPEEADILLATISSLIISRGSGASYAMDLSRSRPHKVASKIPKEPFREYFRKVQEFSKFLSSGIDRRFLPEISIGDARSLPLDDDSVDTIISSPPYLNAIDYIRTSKFTLSFFGHTLEKLRTIRATMVGSEHGLSIDKLPDALREMVRTGVADVKRRPMVSRWVADMHESLSEAYRVTKPGGVALYIVGPSILSRSRYDGADVLAEIAKSAGWIVAGKGRRDYSESNRSLPPPRRNQRAQSIHQRMTCELYVALYKADRNEFSA